MTFEQIAIPFIATVFSGIVGVVVSTGFYVRYERRKEKLETLRRFMGNRYDVVGDEFSRALNEVFVVFKDSPKVMQALSAYHQKVVERQGSDLDELVKLFKSMCDDIGLSYSEFNDSFFLTPFNARPISAITNQSSRRF